MSTPTVDARAVGSGTIPRYARVLSGTGAGIVVANVVGVGGGVLMGDACSICGAGAVADANGKEGAVAGFTDSAGGVTGPPCVGV
jgi:hypothetical protein